MSHCCEWLTDYYHQHPTMHFNRGCGVVNGLQITTTYTRISRLSCLLTVVNSLQITTTYTISIVKYIPLSVVNGLQITTTYTRIPFLLRSSIVVNSLQITTINTDCRASGATIAVVNDLQKSKKDLRKENPVIAGGIFSFLFDDYFL